MSKPYSKPDPKRIGQLIIKSLSEKLALDEEVELTEWISESKENERIYHKLLDEVLNDVLNDPRYADIKRKLKPHPLTKRLFAHIANNRIKYVSVAASLMIIVLTCILFNNKRRGNVALTTRSGPYNYSSPNGIILTLSDGHNIDVDSVLTPITQGNVLLKRNGNELTYIPVSGTTQKEGFNTIRTMAGKQFKIVLQDGSKVWLNAGSSIHYPTSFNNNCRRVEIKGEAFFEIAPLINLALSCKKVPFIVSVNGMEISVKGTRFNLKAYDDDLEMKTSLLEGHVEVKTGHQLFLLQPGQQAVLSKGSLRRNTKFDEEEVLSWKNNLFVFRNLSIEPLMHEISKWYNISVVYEDVIMDEFTTTVPRNIDIKSLLKILEMSSNNVHFRIENDNTVIVSK